MTSIWNPGSGGDVEVTPDSSFLTETQTAIAGQTVVTFEDLVYAVATNALLVFINGVAQDLTTNYTETSTTSITFTSALRAGDIVTVKSLTGRNATELNNAVQAAGVSASEATTQAGISTTQAGIATAQAAAAGTSASNASASATSASNSASSASSSAALALTRANSATASANAAALSALDAQQFMDEAQTQANAAGTSAGSAENFKDDAQSAATQAANSAAAAVNSANLAAASEAAAALYVNEAMVVSLSVPTLQPVIRPSYLVDFSRSEVVPPSVIFTRSSPGSRINPKGIIEQIPANVPRIDYDPITRACRGLLIEETKTNFMVGSEEINTWNSNNVTVTTNAGVAPDGQTTADLVTSNALVGTTRVFRSFVNTNGATYTTSFYVKSNGVRWIRLSSDSNTSSVWFDIIDGVKGTDLLGTGVITPAGAGWYRISRTWQATVSDATDNQFLSFQNADSSTGSFSGDGVTGAFVWGAQCESGTSLTSYIATLSGSTVTRQGDLALINEIQNLAWTNPTEATLFVEADAGNFNQSAIVMELDTGIAGSSQGGAYINRALNANGGDGRNINALVANSGSSIVATLNSGVTVDSGSFKAALVYKANNFAFSCNGSAPVSDSAGDIVIPSELVFGARKNGTFQFNGRIKKVGYYPAAVTNSQLQAMTTY